MISMKLTIAETIEMFYHVASQYKKLQYADSFSRLLRAVRATDKDKEKYLLECCQDLSIAISRSLLRTRQIIFCNLVEVSGIEFVRISLPDGSEGVECFELHKDDLVSFEIKHIPWTVYDRGWGKRQCIYEGRVGNLFVANIDVALRAAGKFEGGVYFDMLEDGEL